MKQNPLGEEETMLHGSIDNQVFTSGQLFWASISADAQEKLSSDNLLHRKRQLPHLFGHFTQLVMFGQFTHAKKLQ